VGLLLIAGADRIAEHARKVLGAIELATADGDLAEIDEVLVVVAVHYGAVEGEDADYETMFYRCSSARIHVQLGLLEQARRAIDRNVRQLDEGDR